MQDLDMYRYLKVNLVWNQTQGLTKILKIVQTTTKGFSNVFKQK
jgi:hypothetical protein